MSNRRNHNSYRPYSHEAPVARDKLRQGDFLSYQVPRVDVSALVLRARLDETEAPLEDAWEDIREELGKAKSLFDQIPPDDFDLHMRAVDLFGGLKKTMRDEYRMQISTNASLKMSELIVQRKLFPRDAGPIHVRAFCNAELPGAFVVAINHYIHTRYSKVASSFDWVASSFFPEQDSDALGDDYGIYAANRDHWLMGPRPSAMPPGTADISGDITDADVVVALADVVKMRFGGEGATLYTSDVGAGVAEDYNRQEELTSALNFGQVVCGLLSLAPGGHFVTKQYTFLTPFSRSLIAIIAAHFEDTYVTKPQTSRPANSEVYIVGKNFKGISAELRSALVARVREYRERKVRPAEAGSLLETIPSAVDDALLTAAKKIHKYQQVDFVREAAKLYDRYGRRSRDLMQDLRSLSSKLQKEWLDINSPDPIDKKYLLPTAPPQRRTLDAVAAPVARTETEMETCAGAGAEEREGEGKGADMGEEKDKGVAKEAEMVDGAGGDAGVRGGQDGAGSATTL